jgi:hypothetical protein
MAEERFYLMAGKWLHILNVTEKYTFSDVFFEKNCCVSRQCRPGLIFHNSPQNRFFVVSLKKEQTGRWLQKNKIKL